MLTVVALIIHMADVREALGHTHTSSKVKAV